MARVVLTLSVFLCILCSALPSEDSPKVRREPPGREHSLNEAQSYRRAQENFLLAAAHQTGQVFVFAIQKAKTLLKNAGTDLKITRQLELIREGQRLVNDKKILVEVGEQEGPVSLRFKSTEEGEKPVVMINLTYSSRFATMPWLTTAETLRVLREAGAAVGEAGKVSAMAKIQGMLAEGAFYASLVARSLVEDPFILRWAKAYGEAEEGAEWRDHVTFVRHRDLYLEKEVEEALTKRDATETKDAIFLLENVFGPRAEKLFALETATVKKWQDRSGELLPADRDALAIAYWRLGTYVSLSEALFEKMPASVLQKAEPRRKRILEWDRGIKAAVQDFSEDPHFNLLLAKAILIPPATLTPSKRAELFSEFTRWEDAQDKELFRRF